MGIDVLGPLHCDNHSTFGRRDRAALCALALRVGRPVSADQLADAVWGDDPPPSSHKSLQGCILRLRKALGPDVIVTSPQGYALLLPAEDVDFRRFERMVGRGRELLALGELERAAYVLGDALDLWRGPAFQDVERWDPAVIEGGRLDELRLEAEEVRVDATLRSGRPLDVLAIAESMVQAAPMRERRWNLLALAQYQAGRQTEALRTIQRVKALLAENLGLDPGPELAALEEGILRQDESLLTGRPVPTSASCPYQGLTPYDVDDSETYFGRDYDVRACLELLRNHRSLAVVGPSGIGKSSLVRAGVGAALRRDGYTVVVIVPGQRPTQSLAALSDAPALTVLLVDQCEEAFSLCSDESDREDFCAALVRWAEHQPIVLAMRADRLADASDYPAFARLLERGLYLLGAMPEQGLRDAVEAPARQAGLLVEPGLVDVLVREVAGTPGALPLLSHALLETWQRREVNTLTVAGYRATGGIRGAVAQSAEKVYASIDPHERHVLRDLVLRLVMSGSEGEPVRARVPRRLISADPEHERLIDLLVRSRLVTSDAGAVEIAHEALARAWPRLRAWLDDDMEGQRIRRHLTGAADSWDSLGRPDSELYRGVRLTPALRWKSQQDTLTDTELAFLDAADRNHRLDRRAAVDRSRSQARLIRRLRGSLIAGTVVLVIALAAGAFAVRQTRAAQETATASEARRAGARALATDDYGMSMLLAVAGVKLDDSPETRSSLLAALGQHPELIGSTQLTGGPVYFFDVSPDGRTVATYDYSNHVRLYDIRSGRLLGDYQAGADSPLGWISGKVRFSPEGDILAVAMAAPTRQPVVLLDADTLKPLDAQPRVSPGRWQLEDVTFSGNGRRLAATMRRVRGSENTLKMTSSWAFAWPVVDPRRPLRRLRLRDGDPMVAMSDDGRTLYTTSPFTIHDLATGDSTAVTEAEPAGLITVSPDGRLLAAPGEGGIILRDADGGRLKRTLLGGDDGWMVSFSADGSRVATVTFAKHEAVVWNVKTGAIITKLPIESGGDLVDFSPDGLTLYTSGAGSSLRSWDLDGGRRFVRQVASAPPSLGYERGGGPSPGGRWAVYPNEEQVSFFDVEKGTLGHVVDRGVGYRGRREGTWHPDGRHYALATGGEIRVWDAETGELVVRGWPSGSHVNAIDYSTDGSVLAVGELSGRVTLLDATTLAPVGRPVQLSQAVRAVSAGPDNGTVITLTGDQDVSGFRTGLTTGWALVDLRSGKVLDTGALDVNSASVVFSPDGRHAALGNDDGQLMVLNLGTGEPVRSPVVGHGAGVSVVVYSPDGGRILTSSADSTVALWEGRTGQLTARVVVPQHIVLPGFGEGSDSVIMATLRGGPLYKWDLRLDHAVEFACRIAARDMTGAEWRSEFGSRPYQHVCPARATG